MEQLEIEELLKAYNIEAVSIEAVQAKSSVRMYKIDGKYLLRCAKVPMENEISKIKRVDRFSNVSRLEHSGVYRSASGPVFYALMNFLPGEDLIGRSRKLSVAELSGLGRDVSLFLEELHSIRGTDYDIGHYVPMIPRHSGSWLDGHSKYCGALMTEIASVELNTESRRLIDDSFAFIESNIGSLEYQNGPRLLHNDFHPKNIIVDSDSFSGVIDWECSQFGEEDFDLSHLIHWCLYPPEPSINLRPFLGSVMNNFSCSRNLPELPMRLTIYQIEHDIHQLIWSDGDSEHERISRIEGWLNGAVPDLLSSLNEDCASAPSTCHLHTSHMLEKKTKKPG